MLRTFASVRTRCGQRILPFVFGSSTSVFTPVSVVERVSKGSIRSYATAQKSGYKRAPRNSEIKFTTVQLVNPETKRLDPPRAYVEILNDIELKDNFVELVSSEPPIVKIVSKREANAARKEIKERRRVRPKNEMKEVQMTWGVGAADLSHKLKKAQEELERGNRVTLAFAPRSRRPVPKPQEMHAFLDEVVQKVSTFAKESQPRTLEKNVAVIYLHAVAKKGNSVKED